MNISVVIPNYNGSQIVKKNLPQVVKALLDHDVSSIIIVDDGSKKDDVLALKSAVDALNMVGKIPIMLVEREKNGGFSSAVNTGVRRAKSDLVVLLNSDVAPYKDFLSPILKRFKENPRLFGVGCMDISIEGSRKIMRGRGVGYWKRGMLNHKRGDINHDDTLWVSGGSSVVRRDLFERLGGMDEIYNPFYWEDIDLSYRAQKAGYVIAFEKKSKVEHRHEEGAIKTHYKKNKVMTIAYRNQLIFHWKNITDSRLIISHLAWLPYYLLLAALRLDTQLLKGFYFALLKLPVIINSRRFQKKQFVVTDRKIIK